MSGHLITPIRPSNYRILGLVGQGQFGRVFCAVHRHTGCLVALKNLEHQRFPTHHFLRELRFLLSLQHPNIVTCQALEHTRTGRYLVMDYCEGGTLRHLMTHHTQVSIHQSIQIVMDILAGLDHAHKRNIIHCDIKPENILLTLQPQGWVARISDFGIARLCQELSGKERGNTGSPAYMAPERFYGQNSPTADLYSVGILFYELLAGYRPFTGTPSELMSAHLNCPVSFPESIPEGLRFVLHKALQKLSARRFRSAHDMLTMLQGSLTNEVQLDMKPQASSNDLCVQPLSQPLFKPFSNVPRYMLQPQWVHSLEAPCLNAGVLSGSKGTSIFWYATDAQLLYCLWSQDSGDRPILEKPKLNQWQLIELSDALQVIHPHARGWLVLTQHQVLSILPGSPPTIMPIARLEPTLQQNFQQGYKALVEEQGRWAAVLEPIPLSETGSHGTSRMLRFYRLAETIHPNTMGDRPSVSQKLGYPCEQCQIIRLDVHHITIVSVLPKMAECAGTQLEILTRRGNHLGMLTLPVSLNQVISTQIPYRLLATETGDDQSILTIDLKPFRMWRSPLEVIPKFLIAASWGSVVVDAAGQIVLIDQAGRVMGQFDGPSHPNAIALAPNNQLLVATWHGHTGQLYNFDLSKTVANKAPQN